MNHCLLLHSKIEMHILLLLLLPTTHYAPPPPPLLRPDFKHSLVSTQLQPSYCVYSVYCTYLVILQQLLDDRQIIW